MGTNCNIHCNKLGQENCNKDKTGTCVSQIWLDNKIGLLPPDWSCGGDVKNIYQICSKTFISKYRISLMCSAQTWILLCQRTLCWILLHFRYRLRLVALQCMYLCMYFYSNIWFVHSVIHVDSQHHFHQDCIHFYSWW